MATDQPRGHGGPSERAVGPPSGGKIHGVKATPTLQVYDLGHLVLVARVVERIGLVPLVDEQVGPRPGEKVSTRVVLKAA